MHRAVDDHEPTSPDPSTWFDEIAAREPLIARLLPELRRIAAADEPVLIVGEPGTGRELVARAIHNLSARAGSPFVEVDCADAGEAFLAPELQGVDEGPMPHKLGAFEQARRGTVLLAEIGELSPALQGVVLACLERGRVLRLRGGPPVVVRARCIATTSIDLAPRVAAGVFDRALRDRLATHVVRVPSLRERPSEIVPLARHFVADAAASLRPATGRAASPRLSAEAELVLRSYPWPGNVHQLRDAMHHAVLAAKGDVIAAVDLPPDVRAGASKGSLRDVERSRIEIAVVTAGGRIGRAARELGVSRWTLRRRLDKYGIGRRRRG